MKHISESLQQMMNTLKEEKAQSNTTKNTTPASKSENDFLKQTTETLQFDTRSIYAIGTRKKEKILPPHVETKIHKFLTQNSTNFSQRLEILWDILTRLRCNKDLIRDVVLVHVLLWGRMGNSWTHPLYAHLNPQEFYHTINKFNPSITEEKYKFLMRYCLREIGLLASRRADLYLLQNMSSKKIKYKK